MRCEIGSREFGESLLSRSAIDESNRLGVRKTLKRHEELYGFFYRFAWAGFDVEGLIMSTATAIDALAALVGKTTRVVFSHLFKVSTNG